MTAFYLYKTCHHLGATAEEMGDLSLYRAGFFNTNYFDAEIIKKQKITQNISCAPPPLKEQMIKLSLLYEGKSVERLAL